MAKLSHIGYILSHYPHRAFGHDGGLGTSVYNLVQCLKVNYKISVFVYGQQKYFEVQEDNVNMYSLNYSSKILGFYRTRKKINDFVEHKIIEDGIQIIEVPDWTGISAFMKFKVPIVMRLHGSDAYFCSLENRKQKLKNRFFEKTAIKNADALIAPSNFALKQTLKIFNLKKTPRSKVIHYGLNLKSLKNDTSDSFNLYSILYLGTLIKKKGVFELPGIYAKVIEKFPDAKLKLIGGDAPDIETSGSSTWNILSKKFGKNVHGVTYLGKVPYHQIQEEIKSAHVCVFPSYAETLGMVTIESMALQKAVINTNIGWSQEIIDHGIDGLMAYPSNHEDFANAILQIFDDDKLRKRLQSGARLKVEDKFDIEKKAIENIEFYKEIIAAQNHD